MGNSVGANGKAFDKNAAKNFLVLDKDTKPSFFKSLVRKSQYKQPAQAIGGGDSCDIPTIPVDAQIFEMGTAMNWLVLGPILILVALLLLAILYYAMRHRKEGYSP